MTSRGMILAVCVMSAAGMFSGGCSGGEGPADTGGLDAGAGDAGCDGACPVAEHGGVTAFAFDGGLLVRGGGVTLTVDSARGLFSVTGAGAVLQRAEARVYWRKDGVEKTTGTSAQVKKTVRVYPFDDTLGSGLRVETAAEGAADDPAVTAVQEVRGGETYITASVSASWQGDKTGDVTATMMAPLAADGRTRGAMFVGQDPAVHRILDNGFDLYFDYTARVYQVGASSSIMFGPGAASNYNMAVYDPVSGRNAVGGFLSMNYGVGVVAVDYGTSPLTSDDGRKGFTRYEGFEYLMDGKPPVKDAGGASLSSGLFYLDLAPETVFDGLESYASRYARRIGKKVWTDVPTGWNSWGGGSGHGGYGTDINYNLMLDNMEALESDFHPWGMKWFMIDDGWMIGEGDWDPDPSRFPSEGGRDGILRLADEARSRGLMPGIWISPFSVLKTSSLAKAHPDWLVEAGGIGKSMVGPDVLLLDLTHPDVLAWLETLFGKMRGYWGFKWFKMDFTYYELFATGLHDPTKTTFEAYKNAIALIRNAVGPDAFLMGVAANGAWLDYADGQRITLDTEPLWGDPPDDQGTKVSYTSFARKYYLSNRVWLNHLDLIFFRQTFGLTFSESRVLASAMTLAGGVFKLGDSYLLLHDHPEWREPIYRMLPVYPRSGRPLDLFDREYPEIWDLKAERDGQGWRVVGLFNWGKNRDVTSDVWEDEGPRDFVVKLSDLGFKDGETVLDVESWTGEYRWITDGKLSRTLGPRTDEVHILRGRPSRPSVVHTSRHLLGTAVEVHGEGWDEGGRKLTFAVDTVPGHAVTALVAVSDRTFLSASVAGVGDLIAEAKDGAVRIGFTPVSALSQVEVKFAE